ncbi:MAG: hypothetical protein H6739_14625 [Alphaproteobacteria bacterium]|nr:hypothetical protein [Alphaproteobacteria bacterium]
MLLSLVSVAWACGNITADISVVPGFGTLPAGVVLRVSANDAEGALVEPEGQDTPLLAAPIAQGWTGLTVPDDLAEGDYELALTAYTGSGSYSRRDYTFSGALSDDGGVDDPVYDGVITSLAPEDPCDAASPEVMWAALSFTLPAAPGPGWVARVVEEESGETTPFYSLEEGATIARSLSVPLTAEGGTVCTSVELFDPRHQAAGGRTELCEEITPGRCAAAPAGALWWLALIGLWRRRTPGR